MNHPDNQAAVRKSRARGTCVAGLRNGDYLVREAAVTGPTWKQNVVLLGEALGKKSRAGVLRSAPRDLQGAAYIEVPHSEDIQDLDEPTGVRVHWLPRNTPTRRIGTLATEAVRGAQLPGENVYAFVAGEQQLASGIRRHLVRDRGFDKSDITFTGYWRIGKAASS